MLVLTFSNDPSPVCLTMNIVEGQKDTCEVLIRGYTFEEGTRKAALSTVKDGHGPGPHLVRL